MRILETIQSEWKAEECKKIVVKIGSKLEGSKSENFYMEIKTFPTFKSEFPFTTRRVRSSYAKSNKQSNLLDFQFFLAKVFRARSSINLQDSSASGEAK